MRYLPAGMSPRTDGLRREILILVGLVLAVDAVFAATYYLADLSRTTGGLKVGYTAVWTVATLVVVLRSLMRIRAKRGR